MEQLRTKPNHHRRLMAAALSGSLLVGNVAMASAAVAQTLHPAPAIARTVAEANPVPDAWVSQRLLAGRLAARHNARLQAGHPHPVTDATSAFTPTWDRCVSKPESNGEAHTPGTGGRFGFLEITWQSEPYAHIWRSQEPPGADWSEPWKAPLRIQAEAALVLLKENGGFGPSAWNNGANCGKNG